MMATSVKNKIRAGTVFLFLLVIISGGFSIYYLVKIKLQSQNVLKANYESLQYGHQMLKALDSFSKGKKTFLDSIEASLTRQEGNITEPGELKETEQLRAGINKLKAGQIKADIIENNKHNLHQIISLNMVAIKTKNAAAEASAEDAMSLLIGIVAIIFIVGLTFVYNFPSVMTAPIQKLTEAIKEIGLKNYTHRVHIDSKDEFGDLANSFNEMAERLEYFENSNLNKLIFEKTRAEAVINSLKDASIGIDRTNIILFANDQALQLLGLNSRDVVGMNAQDVSYKNDLLKFLLEEKGSLPFKIVLGNRENYFIKEVIDIVQQDGSGSKVIVIKNITSFKELDEAKTNFIATVSHELKTPLASADFGLKLLEDERIGTLSQEQKDLIQQLKLDNQRMLRILSELLNMAQVETGKIQLDVASVRPAVIADNAISSVLNAARERNIHINKKYGDIILLVKADAEKTTWVLNNFLTNAIKYSSSDGSVEVNIRQTDSVIEFSVTDHGKGISKEYLPKIFDRFFKVPGSMKSGTGLGLSICKEFIEAQNGKIWVDSEVGVGSIFGFSLPVNSDLKENLKI
jgi:NtrC-family two-component system sensor histidine kinase KinB